MKKLFAAIVVIGLLTYGWYRLQLRPADSGNTAAVSVFIPQGTSVKGIGTLLEEKGIIRSPWAFKWYSRFHKSPMQAGEYSLAPSLSTPAIIAALKSGKTEQTAVTVPEGYAVTDIDALLADKGLITAGDFTKCAQTCDLSAFSFLPGKNPALLKRGGIVEGYLFPDTYYVEKTGFTAEAFLTRLLKTFEEKVVNTYQSDIADSGHSLQEILAMASLVEEESREGEERPIVAGILWKRLEIGMTLGVDAAVRYIVEKPKAALTRSDLDRESPYNLRNTGGLPPGPIANPSLSSIEAALHPVETAYLYYLHDPQGAIHYAETNEEHNLNRAKYLQ